MQNDWESGKKKEEQRIMLLVLVEGLSKLGAEYWGTGTGGSFEFGLNSGKAAHSISYCLFACVLVKE